MSEAAGVAGRHLSGWHLAGLRGAVTALVGVSLGLLVVPLAAELVAPFVRADLIWAGILGAGGGTAVGATWRHSRGRATLLGAATALGLWLIS